MAKRPQDKLLFKRKKLERSAEIVIDLEEIWKNPARSSDFMLENWLSYNRRWLKIMEERGDTDKVKFHKEQISALETQLKKRAEDRKKTGG